MAKKDLNKEQISSENDTTKTKGAKAPKVDKAPKAPKVDKEKIEMQKSIDDLQNQIKLLLAGQSLSGNQTSNNINKKYKMSTLFVGGFYMNDPKVETTVHLPYQEVVEVDHRELEKIIKNFNVRKQLISGTVYFIDEENYKEWDIIQDNPVNEDVILELNKLTNQLEITQKIKLITKERRDIEHVLLWYIVDLIAKGKLPITYIFTNAIEGYFKQDVKNLVNSLTIMQQFYDKK